MAFNGSGIFERLYNWVTDRNDGIKILADRMDAEMDGMADALSLCLTKDGQQTVTANIPLAGFKITNLGDANSATDALNRQTADARYHPIGVTTTVDNTVPRFNGTAGALQESGITVDDSNNVTGVVGLTATGAVAGASLATSSTGVGTQITATSTDAGANVWPALLLDRFSATPAASDNIAGVIFRGRDNAANTADYAAVRAKILDTTDTSEDGQLILATLVAGADTAIITAGPGVQIGAPTGGDKGAGTLNTAGSIYVNNSALLVASNNLSDLGTVATARGNLGYPSTTTDNTVPRFDGTAGAMQTSAVAIDDSNNITGVTTLSATIPSAGSAVLTASSTSGTASVFTGLLIDRNSASPAADDVLSNIVFRGRDSGANAEDFATIEAVIVDPTNASEDGRLWFKTLVAGASTVGLQIDDSGVTVAVTATFSGRAVHSGKFSFGTSTATISTDAITYTGPYMVIDTESAAATDNLATINGGTNGDVLYLQTANSSRDVTIKHTTGNIALASAADETLGTQNQIAMLRYGGTNWRGGKITA